MTGLMRPPPLAESPASVLPSLAMVPALREALRPTQTEWGASRWGEYRRCHRAHHLRYHLRLTPTPRREDPLDPDERADTSYFEVGQLVHAAHRWMREGVLASEHTPRNWRHVLAVAPLEGGPYRPYALEHVWEAERLLQAYYARWGVANAGFPEECTIVGVEQELSAPEGSAIAPYTARADAILRLPSGELIVVDDKTRGRSFPRDTEGYARGLTTRPQFAGLSWLVWQDTVARPPFDSAPPIVWVNAIVKTKVVQLARLVVPITRASVERWHEAQARDAAGGVADDAPCFDACAPEMGSRCTYFTWCHGTDEERARHFQVRAA